MVAVFSVAALLMAAIGLYGVIAYSVAERRFEFATRAALGATPRDLFSMTCFHTLKLVVTGVLLGIVASLVLGRAMAGFLFGVQATNVFVYGATALAITIMGLASTLAPACQAARSDCALALKQ